MSVEIKPINESRTPETDVMRRIHRTQDMLEDAGFSAKDADLIIRTVEEFLVVKQYRLQFQARALAHAKDTIAACDKVKSSDPPPSYDEKK